MNLHTNLISAFVDAPNLANDRELFTHPDTIRSCATPHRHPRLQKMAKPAAAITGTMPRRTKAGKKHSPSGRTSCDPNLAAASRA